MLASKTLISVRVDTKLLKELKQVVQGKTVTNLVEEGLIALKSSYAHKAQKNIKEKEHPLEALFGILSETEGDNLIRNVNEERQKQIEMDLKNDQEIDNLFN